MTDHTATVATLIERVTDCAAEDIGPGSRFESLGNWNSLAALGLLTSIEDHYQVRLDLREYLAVGDVAGLLALLDGALGGRQPVSTVDGPR